MRTILLLATSLALCGCSKPPVPEAPPEPQVGATQLRDAINEPLDKAKAVEAAQAAEEAERQKVLQDAGG